MIYELLTHTIHCTLKKIKMKMLILKIVPCSRQRRDRLEQEQVEERRVGKAVDGTCTSTEATIANGKGKGKIGHE